VSTTEVVDYGYIIVCIYRSPDGNFWIFLKNLEVIIQKMQSRNKKPLLYCDWNLNFMVNNKKITRTTKSISYNMMNIVRSPTRITPSTESLTDVIITYKDIPVLSTAVVDLGLSDHLAQIVEINIGKKK
jgi:hypothetical protein